MMRPTASIVWSRGARFLGLSPSCSRTIAPGAALSQTLSAIPRDWTNPGVQVIADRVCESAAPGAIVLLHDGDSPKNLAPRDQTIEAVGLIIDRLRAEGYEFVTIEELNK